MSGTNENLHTFLLTSNTYIYYIVFIYILRKYKSDIQLCGTAKQYFKMFQTDRQNQYGPLLTNGGYRKIKETHTQNLKTIVLVLHTSIQLNVGLLPITFYIFMVGTSKSRRFVLFYLVDGCCYCCFILFKLDIHLLNKRFFYKLFPLLFFFLLRVRVFCMYESHGICVCLFIKKQHYACTLKKNQRLL